MLYTDLAQTGSAHAGTDVDPYSWADLKAFVDDGYIDTHKIKGEKAVSDFFGPYQNASNIYENWLSNAPFRLEVSTEEEQDYINGTWKRCILKFNNGLHNLIAINDYAQFDTVFLHCTGQVVFETASVLFRGGTFIIDSPYGLYLTQLTNAYIFTDTQIAIPNWFIPTE